MTTKSMRLALLLPLTAVLLTACGKKDAPADSRQVELAPAPAGTPQLGDTATAAEAPAPVKEETKAPAKAPVSKPAATKPAAAPSTPPAAAPASAPAAAAPAKASTGTIAGGLTMAATLGSRVCTNTHKVGDRVTATLASTIPGTNGASLPAGATLTLSVSESTRGENGKEGMHLALVPVSVTFGGSTYAIDGTATIANLETVRAQTSGDQAKKVATGAVIGAIAGQIMGKRAKSAAIGAAVGAAAGGAVAVGSADWNGCVADGGKVSVTLSSPVTVKVVADKPGI